MSFGSFGQPRPGGFGASSTPAFGAASTPAFGSTTPAPAFGATGAFGAPQQTANSFSFGGGAPATPAPAFGTPAPAFGAASTPAFGQPAQAQGGFGQPQQAPPAFGGFGASTSATPAFGAANNAFNTPAKPAFGGFGAGATNTFGQPAQTPAFGQPQQQQGGLFGQPQQQQGQQGDWWPEFNDIFMKDHPADQDDTRVGWIRVPTGSQNLFPADGTAATELFDPKNPREYKDPVADDGKFTPNNLRQERQSRGQGNMPNPQEYESVKKKIEARKPTGLRYHAITAVEPFRNASFEELRLRDYEQNRRQPTQQKPQIKLELYGPHSADPSGTAPANAPFGSNLGSGTGNLFGGGSNTFGQPQQPTGGNIFGGQTNSTPFGAGNTFGQPQQQPQANVFGGAATTFGQPQTGGNLFGGGTSTFGQPASTPAPFGATPAPSSQAPTFGSFGATPQPTGFGQTPAPQPFGATSTPPSFGGFGAKPPGTTSLFGQPTTTQAPTNNLFGAPPGPTPGLFGAQSTAQSTPGFGQNAPGTTPFGAAPTTTAPFSGFGQQPSQTQQPTNNLFGGGSSNAFGLNKPTTSLFGQPQAQPQAQNNLFGGFNSGAPKAPTFGGLGQPPAPSFNLGGSTLGAGGLGGGQMGNSFGGFGNSMMGQPQQQQAQLQASIDQNAYGQSPLFNSAPGSTAPAAPFAVVEKAKPPLALPVRGTPRAGSALNRLRGYGTPTSTATAGSSLSWSASPSSATRGSPLSSLPSLGDSSNSVSPHAFIGRSSVKKLVIERKNSDSPGKPVANTPGRLRFDPDAEIAATNGTPSRSATPEVAAAPREEPRTQPSSGAGRSEGSNRRVSSGSRGVPYIFDPPLEELRAMPYEELSKVDRFKVSRAGIGEISWPGPVDLSGIGSLEQIGGGIVKIEARKASVYASDEYLDDKPPEGQGLNKPAKVTLCDIWPINLADRQPIKERGISEDLDARIDEFARKLTQYNVKRPAVESATYDHSEGKWTFRVRHFSGYGLDDDDELIAAGGDMDVDDEDGQSPAPAVKRRSRRQQALPAEEDMQLEEGSGEESDDGTISDGPPTPAADDRETERESSAERDYEEARHAIDSQRDDDESDGASSIVSPPPARGSHLGWLSGKEPGREELMRGSLFSQAKAPRPSMAIASQRFVLPPSVPFEISEPNIAPAVERPPRQYNRVKLDNSINGKQQGSFVDAGHALGRSFRVSFGPNGQIVRPARARGDAVLLIDKPLASSYGSASTYDELLNVHLEQTDIRAADLQAHEPELRAPTAQTRPSLRFRHLAQQEATSQASTLKLASALFDDLDLRLPDGVDEETKGHVTDLLRQRELTRWLEEDVRSSAEADARLANGATSRIFAHLTAHQIEVACDVAISSGNLRLATLLAQAGTTDLAVRGDIALQLDRWHEQKVDAHLDPAMRKVYEVLAGNVTHSERREGDAADTSQSIFIPADLDWKRVFGLHLWYAAPRPALSLGFPSYESALVHDTRTARPTPRWAIEAGKTVQINDAAFELLKLAAPDYPLEIALAAQGFTQSPIDARLPWHFAVVLERALRERIFQDAQPAADSDATISATADGLTAAFALQLETMGRWAWAVFVLMHQSSPISRTMGIKEVLARNVARLGDDHEGTSFVVEQLGVPAAWLFEAQAIHAHYKGNLWEEMRLCLNASLLDDAHRISVKALAPEAVLADDVDLLLRLFEPYQATNDIAGWSDGGGLFCDYAACIRTADGAHLRRVGPRLVAALPGLITIRGKHDLRARACYSTMLARVSRLAMVADGSGRVAASVEMTALRADDRLVHMGDALSASFASAIEVACA